MSTESLRGVLLDNGTVEFEHGVEKHPDFDQLGEHVFGDLIADAKLMDQRWWAWLAAGMPGLRDAISEHGPNGARVSTFNPGARPEIERELGQRMRSAFLVTIEREADEFAGWLLSNPAQLEKWRAEREDAQAERQWEESQRRYA